ncbi:hypothetical protein [Streptomyces coffeae]|uniref:Uncharacterized protein n=1 Tax=Streptomyces coffeae TaxID=621382 RepID=A0ABS1NLT4_9ACTN|nr:hypothetical protein [Streptomyces coffeae]MBL1101060.1 hypothetical protein [Streptomyces coffeae]
MSLSVEMLQELPSTEEAALAAADCCWNSLVDGCNWWSLTISSCHSCTNTA